MNPQEVLQKLTLAEKIKLTAGSDLWRTVAIPRVGLPYIKLTDGPNGARGGGDFNDSTPSTLFPAPSCVGATWDVALAEKMGNLIAKDAIEKQCHVLLGPTINMQRDPRAGRFFESYSEDPVLMGELGYAWTKGAQATGIAATFKHLICNEAELDRRFSSSNVSQEALREIYLEPFRLIMAKARRSGELQPACIMTAYNRTNDVPGSENVHGIRDILRKEWGFSGLVMSDWFGMHAPAFEGTDLEMPGPTIFRRVEDTEKAIKDGKINEADVERSALKVLELIARVAPLGYRKSLEDEHESSIDVNLVGPTIRQIAAEGAVLLKNDHAVLPLKPKSGMRIACIGEPWVEPVQSAGGSSNLTPQKSPQALAALKQAFQDAGLEVHIDYHRGCDFHNYVRTLTSKMQCEYYSGRNIGQGEKIATTTEENATLKNVAPKPKGIKANDYWARGSIDIEAAQKDVTYKFGAIALGSLTIRANRSGDSGEPDDWKYQGEKDLFEFIVNPLKKWQEFRLEVKKGQKVHVEVDWLPQLLHEEYKETLYGGFQIGMEHVEDQDVLIKEAADLAQKADVAIVLTAVGKDWESEGFDRPDIALPRRQNDLVAAIAKANPTNSIVLNQTGSVVEMPWHEAVPGIVQCWYGGQETAEALVDVLLARGEAPASGRLPHTWPKRIEDHPSGTDSAYFPGAPGKAGPMIEYIEGRLMGYKSYDKHGVKPAYSFGEGLGGYTTFETSIRNAKIEEITSKSLPLRLSVSSKNTGKHAGKNVIQIYVRTPENLVAADKMEPVQKLAGFTTHRINSGESTSNTINLYQEAFSHWNETKQRWDVRTGTYKIIAATACSRADESSVVGSFDVQIDTPWSWTGLGV